MPAVAERAAPPSAAGRWVARGDPDYPARLCGLPHEPDGLWVRTAVPSGTLAGGLWEQPAVAVVGSRAASATGLDFTRGLAYALADAGVLVVSGLARGIDAAAHEGALLAGGQTVGVLACGIEDCYPPEHAPLAARIAAGAALLSEWPAATPATAWRFPRRNRLISGLADVVVLVEASPRSGTAHTVRFALEQGREVMAVPRDPTLPGSDGPNALLFDGAALARGAADVLAALENLGRPARGRSGQDRACLQPAGGGPGSRAGDSAESSLMTRLRAGRSLSATELTNALPEIAPGELLSALVVLEMTGRVRRDGQGRYALASG